MSDAPGPRRLPLIAIGAAVLALLFALVAVIVVITRKQDPQPAKPAQAPPIADHTVKATDVLALKSEQLETVVEAGTMKGVRIKDAALARALGLDANDIITAVSGTAMTHDSYARSDVIWRLTMFNPTIVYVEVLHQGESQLVRWKLDGELRSARSASLSTLPSLGGLVGTGTSTVDLSDAALNTIERVDDTTVKLPRATADQVLASPLAVAKGARVVPAVKNGQVDGFKLYAIRPNSVYARLGFMNGDTIDAINGVELTTPDKALELYTKLKTVTAFSIDITRRGQPMTLKIQITK